MHGTSVKVILHLPVTVRVLTDDVPLELLTAQLYTPSLLPLILRVLV